VIYDSENGNHDEDEGEDDIAEMDVKYERMKLKTNYADDSLSEWLKDVLKDKMVLQNGKTEMTAFSFNQSFVLQNLSTFSAMKLEFHHTSFVCESNLIWRI
jgi:hypothetical protein